MTIKNLLIELLEDERTEEDRLEGTLDPNARDASGTYDDWSAKDTLAHSAEWMFAQVAGRTEAEITAPFTDSDGQDRPPWRRIAFYGVLHPIAHLGKAYIKGGDSDYAVTLLEKITGKMAGLNEEDQWLGILAYNLAAVYALAGELSNAIKKLKEAGGLNPPLGEWAQQDPDMESLRNSTFWNP